MTDAAVLTGDLIGSRKAGQNATDSAIAALAETAAQLKAPFTRYRGDGWQALLLRPELALRFALIATARLRAQGLPLTRFAIGIAEISPTRAASLGAETGKAFVLSGETLDQMPRRAEFGISRPSRQHSEMTWAASRLADQVARKWTQPQAEAMVMALEPEAPSGAAIATALGISPAAASYRLQGASWWDIKAVVSAFEAELKAADD